MIRNQGEENKVGKAKTSNTDTSKVHGFANVISQQKRGKWDSV
jgi:hypothetical protein